MKEEESTKDGAESHRLMVLVHLVEELDGEKSTVRELFQHLRPSFQWTLEECIDLVQRGIDTGALTVKSGERGAEATVLVSGQDQGARVPEEVQTLVQRIVRRTGRVAPVDKFAERRQAILCALSPTSPKTTPELWQMLDPDLFPYKKKLARDLVVMENSGLIEKVDAEGWISAPLSEGAVAEHASIAALNLLLALYDDLVPVDIQDALKSHVKRAEKRLQTLPRSDPRVRWLNSLRIVSPVHDLDLPVIKGDVREAIESAILGERKIRLKWQEVGLDGDFRVLDRTGSISHLLTEIRGRAVIDFWVDGKGNRIALEDIIEAELLDTPAQSPPDYEPVERQPQIKMTFGDAKEHGGESLVVLRMKGNAFHSLANKRIARRMTVLEDDGDWLVTSFRCRLDLPTCNYLFGLKDVVILSPKLVRAFAIGPIRAAYDNYGETAQLAMKYCQMEEEAAAKFD